MNPLLEKLHDIEGLDLISPWPFSFALWTVIAVAALLVLTALYFTIRRIIFIRSWKYDTFQKLDGLEKNLSELTARESAMTLSEYVRRIALKRFARKECAGLVGESWLKWLSKHDPKKFDWEKKGTLLIEVPYSPECSRVSTHEIKDLIGALREWVE
jgi:cell division protein FtsL